jgi:hypothetical protein
MDAPIVFVVKVNIAKQASKRSNHQSHASVVCARLLARSAPRTSTGASQRENRQSQIVNRHS